MEIIKTVSLFMIQVTKEEVEIIINALNEHCPEDVELGNKECGLMEQFANLID